MKRMVGVSAVVNLFTTFLASLFRGFTKLSFSALVVLLKIFVDLSLNYVTFEQRCRISSVSPVRLNDILFGRLEKCKVVLVPNVPVAYLVELDVTHVRAEEL